MSKTYGYARVSSKEQHLDRQILRLQEYVEKDQIIVDKQSGATMERPGYQALKGQLGLRAGDVLYICSLDRLSKREQDMEMKTMCCSLFLYHHVFERRCW